MFWYNQALKNQGDTMQEKYLQEDEIDLRELFKTIWARRFFVIAFTLVVTVLAAVYAYTKTPIYEA